MLLLLAVVSCLRPKSPLPTHTSHLPPHRTCRYNFDLNNGGVHISWFNGAETNVAYNCLDRHVLAGKGDQPAFFWEGNDVGQATTTTYLQVLQEVCRVGNYLRSQGVGTGDDVTIYMPMIPELPIAMVGPGVVGVGWGGWGREPALAALADAVSAHAFASPHFPSCLRPRSSPAPASAPSSRSSLLASRQSRWPGASPTPPPSSSSPAPASSAAPSRSS